MTIEFLQTPDGSALMNVRFQDLLMKLARTTMRSLGTVTQAPITITVKATVPSTELEEGVIAPGSAKAVADAMFAAAQQRFTDESWDFIQLNTSPVVDVRMKDGNVEASSLVSGMIAVPDNA